jgi:EPP (Eye Pigment Precursor) family transporter
MEEGSVAIEVQAGVLYSWRAISVSTQPGRTCWRSEAPPGRRILTSVTGQARPGELLAIMGPSGAGKTTLLNVLTFRHRAGLEVSGERVARGRPVSPTSLTAISGYVQQEDLFLGTLTVRETLEFQSRVRTADRSPAGAGRQARVQQLLEELGLAGIAGTRVAAISGGERKRLAIAAEMLSDPALLFCDEPTSGLDSAMAASVMELLGRLARQGRTVVCTVHQPSSQVFASFDQLLLLAGGNVAYLGPARGQAKRYFANQGFPCPEDFNPADHLVSLLAVAPGREAEDRKRVQALGSAFQASEEGGGVEEAVQRELEAAGDLELDAASPYLASWGQQLGALAWRNGITTVRDPLVAKVRIIQAVVIAVILGVVYFGQNLDQKGIQNINGVLFLLLTNVSFGNLLSVVNVFCAELPIFRREHYSGLYRIDVYFIAKQMIDLPLFVMEPLIITTILYWMAGLNPDPVRFLTACGIVLLVVQAVLSVGYLLSCACPSVDLALTLGPVIVIPFMLFGGFYLNAGSIPAWLDWFKYISWFFYSFEALMGNQWNGVEKIACPEARSGCLASGEEVLLQLSLRGDRLAWDLGMLLLLATALRLAAYLALLARTRAGRS